MNIKVLGSGCCNCKNLLENVKQAVAQKGTQADIEYITDMKTIVSMGIMSTPALVIDGKIVSMGRVLNEKQVLDLLNK